MAPRREFVQLASTWKERGRLDLSGWLWSIKLDGMRFLWDGGVSRGIRKEFVKWANITHDFRYKIPPVATGLWSRYGNIIHAPDWFLDSLPVGVLLDGELYSHAIERETLFGTVKSLVPDERWRDIHGYIFDSPPPATFLAYGEVKNPNFNRVIDTDYREYPFKHLDPSTRYRDVLAMINNLGLEGNLHVVEQNELPMMPTYAEMAAEGIAEGIIAQGEEGIILRHPLAPYEVTRSKHILKIKGWEEDEGEVTGFEFGNEGKYAGLVGSLTIRWKNRTFQLSGMTDAQREPGIITGGMVVTFRYRRLSSDGLPIEARLVRVRDYER